MEITKREVLVSLVIVSVLLIVGFLIGGKINEHHMEKVQEYNTALQIDNNRDLFEYGMKTNVGRAFVYGTLQALDPVSYDEVDGEYSSIKKVKERYTRHTRTVTKTRTVDGKTETYTEEEVYYSWDYVSHEETHATKISFIDVEFPYGTINFPERKHIKTKQVSSTIRYVYSGAPVKCEGTIYAILKNNTISDVSMNHYCNIEDTLESYNQNFAVVVFWILWIFLLIVSVIGFLYLDNYWLD